MAASRLKTRNANERVTNSKTASMVSPRGLPGGAPRSAAVLEFLESLGDCGMPTALSMLVVEEVMIVL
jgi:hypothetical protein